MNRTKETTDISNMLTVAATLEKISEYESKSKISPTDLAEFLPWACLRLGLDFVPHVIKRQQAVFISPSLKNKKSTMFLGRSGFNEGIDASTEDKIVWSVDSKEIFRNVIHVIASYAGSELMHLEFGNAKILNRKLLTLISLIVEFFPNLQGITISCGIDQFTVYELCKVLTNSNLTELYLDDTFVKEANYDIILEDCFQLQLLSLARCRIGDEAAKEIAGKLHYPRPASRKLCVLNLSSNRLTDASLKSFAEALRSNRKLCYLNLAGNFIHDEGGIDLLKTMLQFRLTEDEAFTYKQRYVDYLKFRQEVIIKYLSDLKETESKKPSRKSIAAPRKTTDVPEPTDYLYEKAVELAEKAIGQFEDPYCDGEKINEFYYCNGNNTLVYINLAYNSLSFKFLQWLLRVVQYQQNPERKMKGILNVRLEGNPMPRSCPEMTTIDMHLEFGVSASINSRTTIKQKDKKKK